MTDSPLDKPAEHPTLPSGTVTLLFTDIEGSTRLLEHLREHYAPVVAEHDAILRDALAPHHGHEIRVQGDSFFVAFRRAADAAAYVAQVQRDLAAHEWPPDAAVRVRMGLHTGEPVVARADYEGLDVHLAARISAAGHGGQVLLSQTTRDLIHEDLPAGVSLRELGPHKLKDIRHPQPLYQLDVAGLPAEFPPLRTLPGAEAPPAPGPAPFKGLQFFDTPDAHLFYGRAALTARLVEHVRQQRFLAVVGASGSGKSSIIRAGLVPALQGADETSQWAVHVITPTAHPLEALATSLTRDAESVTATLLDDLAAEPRSLHLTARRTGAARLLLVVDQLEELFTLCHQEPARRAFVNNLLHAVGVEDGPLTVVVGLRADFYAHLAQYAELREAVAQHQVYLGAMSAAELRQAIEEPAQHGGWDFAPGLVELLLHDVGASADREPEPGALPLLSHALLATWQRRRGITLTLKGYYEAGGVRGAIARTAENVFYQELTPDQQTIARSIFLRLTELGEGTQDTRRRAAVRELVPPAPRDDAVQVEEVLVKLADARLITTSAETVEVAHEALIREWPTLREWLAEDREGLRVHRHLTQAAQEWELLAQDTGALYRGVRLVQALEWAAAHPGELNAQEQAFLAASQEWAEREAAAREAQRQRELEQARDLAEEQQRRAEAEQQRAEEQTRSASQLRRRAVYLGVALVLALVATVAAGVLGYLATEREQDALTKASIGLAARAESQLEDGHADLAVLLALGALEHYPYTPQAESALARAVAESRPYLFVSNQGTRVRGLTWAPDGQRFVTVSDEYAIIWDAHTGQELVRFPEFTTEYNFMSGVAWFPAGDRIATGFRDNLAKVWDAVTGRELLTLAGHTGEVTSVAVSPPAGGALVVTGSQDGTAKIWNPDTGAEILTLTGHSAAVHDVAWDPSGDRILTVSEDGTARVWQAQTGAELLVISGLPGGGFSATWSPDGMWIGLGSGEGLVSLWNASTGENRFTLTGHTDVVRSIAWSPPAGGDLIATASADGTVRVWEAATGTELFDLPGLAKDLWVAAWSPDGQRLAAAGALDFKVWDVSNRPLRLVGHTTMIPPTPRWSPDGQRIATSSLLGDVKIWDARTGQELLSLPERPRDSSYTYVVWSPNGERIVTGHVDGLLRVWDASTGAEVAVLAGHTGFSSDIAWSPDGTRIVSTSADRTARVWDPVTGQQIAICAEQVADTGGNDFSDSPSWSPAGDRVVVGATDGLVRVWDPVTGEVLLTLTGHEGWVAGTSWSPPAGGKRIATGGSDSTCRIWDAETGAELQIFLGHTDIVYEVQWAPNGQRVASCDDTGTVKVWDADTGNEVMSFEVPGSATGVDWSPDGKYLIVGGFFYVPVVERVWQTTEELVTYAKEHCVFRQLTPAERDSFGLPPR